MLPTNPINFPDHISFTPNYFSVLIQAFRENMLYVLFVIYLYFLSLLTISYFYFLIHWNFSSSEVLTVRSTGNISVGVFHLFLSDVWHCWVIWSLKDFILFKSVISYFPPLWSFIFHLINIGVSHNNILSYYLFIYTHLVVFHSHPYLLY